MKRPRTGSAPNATRRSKRIRKLANEVKFQYDALEKEQRQIRLFELLPGDADQPLQGTLTTVHLSDDPEYDALSYVWGSTQRPHRLSITDAGFIAISENLQKALTGLRMTDQSRILWVDAICINQDDVLERGHQVKLMRAVYSGAATVRVWLQSSVDIKSKPFQVLPRLEGPSVGWLFPKATPLPYLRNQVKFMDYDLDFWDPVYRIFEDPYWQRIWTQQELYLARNLSFHSPTGCLHPEYLIRFEHMVFWLSADVTLHTKRLLLKYYMKIRAASVFSSLYTGFATQRGVWGIRGIPEFERPILLNLCCRSVSLKATDPRDLVYGLLGLAVDCDENDIQPDYNLPINQVHNQVIQHFMKKHQTLDFLCHKSAYKLQTKDFPTWNPMSKHNAVFFDVEAWNDWKELFVNNRSMLIPNGPLGQIKDRTLTVRGVGCDLITFGPLHQIHFAPILDWAKEVELICAAMNIPRWVQSDEVLEVLKYQTTKARHERLFARQRLTSDHLTDLLSFVAQLQDRNATNIFNLANDFVPLPSDIPEDVVRTIRELNLAFYSSAFVGTRGNRPGLCHHYDLACQVMNDDKVWVILGCSMPMVLRPQQPPGSSERGHYSIIGPAVFHDLMGGELCGFIQRAMNGLGLSHGLSVETIHLV